MDGIIHYIFLGLNVKVSNYGAFLALKVLFCQSLMNLWYFICVYTVFQSTILLVSSIKQLDTVLHVLESSFYKE